MKKTLTFITLILISFVGFKVTASSDKDLTFSYLNSNNQTIEESIENMNNLVIHTNMIRYETNDNVITHQFPDIRSNTSFKLSYELTSDAVLVVSGSYSNTTTKRELKKGDLFKIENKSYKINGETINSIGSYASSFSFITPTQEQFFKNTPLENYYIKHRYSINQSTEQLVHGFDLVVNKSDLDWVENKVYEIAIPSGYKVFFKNNSYDEPNPRKEYLSTDNIEIKAIRSGSSQVFEISVNDIYVGRIGTEYTFKFYSDKLTTINIYYAREGNWLFQEAFIATENAPFSTLNDYLVDYKHYWGWLDLEEHQVFKWSIHPGEVSNYFDDDNDIEIADSDIINSNMKIYQKIGYSENTTVNITYETNVPGHEELDLIHTYDLKDYYDDPVDEWRLRDFNYQFPVLDYEGFLFSHWEKFEKNQWVRAELGYSNTGDLLLKAIFIDKSVPIQIKVDYVSGIQLFEILPGQSIPYEKLEIRAKVSKRFVGFSLHPSHPNDSEHSHFIDLENEVFVSDKRVYAIYEDVIYYNVTFDVDGGVYIPPMKVRANTNNFAAELPEAVKSKHIFLGWFLDKELTIPAPITSVSKYNPENIKFYDITLYASYHNNGSKVYFHTNSSGLEISPIVITKGQSINISTPPKRTGYIFEGWFLDSVLTDEYLGEPIEVDEVNLYAKWSIDESNPPVIEEESSDNYNLYIYIIIGVMVVGGYMLFKPKKKYRRRRR